MPKFAILVLAIAVGFGAGYYTKTEFAKAKQFDAVAKVQHQTATHIQESLNTSLVVDTAAAASTQQVAVIRKKVAAQIKQLEKTHEETPDAAPVCRTDLSNGTVFLLNTARLGSADRAAEFSDDSVETASGIGLAELADSDLEVVQLYRDLAVRHDALVDYVEHLMKKQAK